MGTKEIEYVNIGDRLLFPIANALKNIENIADYFSEDIIMFLPKYADVKKMCKELNWNIENIYLCNDPYNLFVYYDNKFLYYPFPLCNDKVISQLNIDSNISELTSCFKKYINRKNYIKIFSLINNDVKLNLFISKYHSIPDKQKPIIFKNLIEEYGFDLSVYPSDILFDIYSKFDKKDVKKMLRSENKNVTCFSIYNNLEKSLDSIWTNYDSAVNYARHSMEDADIQLGEISKNHIISIINDRFLLKQNSFVFKETLSNIYTQISLGDLLRRGYKTKCALILDEILYSINSLETFYNGDVLTKGHSIKMASLGILQGCFNGLSNRDLHLLSFSLAYIGLCDKEVEFPSAFLDDILLTNSLPIGDGNIARYLIDLTLNKKLSKEYLLEKYNLTENERLIMLKDNFSDILNLSLINSEFYDSESLHIESSKRFVEFWKNSK